MAKIKFGMMMTDARGKLGGQVFSKNRSGAYVRTKVTPVNPRTTSQQANRSILGTLSSGWSSLTDTQRSAWNSAVEAWQKTNVFGDLTKPTGKNLYTGLNKVMLQHFPTSDVMVNPPAKVEFQPFVLLSVTLLSTGLITTLNFASGGSTTQTYRVRATGNISPGTTYVQNLLRTIGTTFTVSEENTISVRTAWSALYGNLVVGQKVAFEVTPVAENGQLGVPAIVMGIVGA